VPSTLHDIVFHTQLVVSACVERANERTGDDGVAILASQPQNSQSTVHLVCPTNSVSFTVHHNMMSQCILVDLPEVIFRALRDQWLRTKNIVRLDSAFCNRQFRRHFTGLAYESSKIYSPGGTEACMYVPFLRWVLARDTHIDELTVVSDLLKDDKLCTKVLSANSRRLTTLRFSSYNFGDRSRCKIFTEMISLCSIVRNVHIHATANVDSAGVSRRDETFLTVAADPFPANGIAEVLSRCENLERLSFTCTAIKVSAGIAISSLTYLDCRSADIEGNVLYAAGQRCPNLESLYVISHNAGGSEDHITDDSVRVVLEGCPKLRNTDLFESRLVSDELRAELARRCDLTEVTFSAWDFMSNSLAQEVLRVCPNLVKLNCADCAWLRDTTLAAAALHCPLITTVAFEGCFFVTNGGIRVLASGLTNQLRVVTLRDCPHLKSGALQAIAEHCPLLEEITCLLNVSDAAVVRLAEACPELRHVCLEHTQVGDAGVIALTTHCLKLSALYLYNCSNITMQGAQSAIAGCPHLRHLGLPAHLEEQLQPLRSSLPVALQVTYHNEG
jgi:hypothetical protein